MGKKESGTQASSSVMCETTGLPHKSVRKCAGQGSNYFLTLDMRATASEIGYVRTETSVVPGREGLGALTLPGELARLRPYMSIGYSNPSLLPSEFPKDNIRDIILREPPAFAF